ncbi:Transcription elongation factor S-II [Smittium culicis]|uniref:Transcription elongation factor n=1 Tax=Smittium culicis TaxID=133412 RepID=A0A1R1YMS7_9FUNG|nr:Transcription elongation factor S-II [Smittium culicis]
MAVGKLRNDKNEKISKLAKSIVQKWKKNVTEAAAIKKKKLFNCYNLRQYLFLLEIASSDKPKDDTKNANKSNSPTQTINSLEKVQTSSSNSPKLKSQPETNSSANAPENLRKNSDSNINVNKTRTFASDNATIQSTGDKSRDKCIEMLYNALAVDTDAETDLIVEKAMELEQAEFNKFNAVNPTYKADIRSFYLNLKDLKNPNLRLAIMEGTIQPNDFVLMSPEDMASEERKKLDDKIMKENLFKAQGAGPQEAETDMFRCSKCGSRKCRYFQMQTRSADEPMTTFVNCTNCGKRWKFC